MDTIAEQRSTKHYREI